jgi:hypothetical protein
MHDAPPGPSLKTKYNSAPVLYGHLDPALGQPLHGVLHGLAQNAGHMLCIGAPVHAVRGKVLHERYVGRDLGDLAARKSDDLGRVQGAGTLGNLPPANLMIWAELKAWGPWGTCRLQTQ